MPEQQIVLASGNVGKLKEMAALLSGLSIKILPQSNFSVPEAEETGLSFVENALIKARNACIHTNKPAIADDSGIEVDFLEGAPGIYSSRYAGEGASDEENLQLLIDNILDRGLKKPAARFQCVMVYLRHSKDPTPIIAHGTWQGHLVTEPAGTNGFGYDPIFFVTETGCTSAEISPQVKNQISHRGQAMRDLLKIFSFIFDKQ